MQQVAVLSQGIMKITIIVIVGKMFGDGGTLLIEILVKASAIFTLIDDFDIF